MSLSHIGRNTDIDLLYKRNHIYLFQGDGVPPGTVPVERLVLMTPDKN